MTQPGWYDDPYGTGGLRWWDGRQWTEHATPPPPDAAHVLAAEEVAARRARTALLVGAGLYAANFLTTVWWLPTWWDDLTEQFDAAARGSQQTVQFGPGYFVSQLCGLGLLAVGIVFLNWFYRSAQLAERGGRRHRHSPGWATASFVVPIIQYWFPYQATVDMTAGAREQRRAINRWWALWIATSVTGLVVGAVALWSTAAGLVVALLGAGVAWAAALAGRDVIDVVVADHRRLLGAQDSA